MSSKSISMSLVSEDEDNTHSLQRETSEISSHLDDFPKHIHFLVVDSKFNTLFDMKKIMAQHPYQVTAETDGVKALEYLTTCEHDINIVVWDFNMPGVNGIQALKDIGSKLDIPVVIMSDDTESDSLMEAIINGACDYITKPVPEDIIANMWQHLVRKRMVSEPEAPVQSNLAQSNVSDKGTDVSMFVSQPDLVQTNGLDQENDNGSNSIEKKDGRSQKKDRMKWDPELHQKFLDAIELLGGIGKAYPKRLHECLQEMNVDGLTRENVGSHLQKHRMAVNDSRIPKYSHLGLSTAYSPTQRFQRSNKDLLRNHLNNVHTAASSSSPLLTNSLAVNPVQQNQYQNSYLPMNNNQLITNQVLSPFHHSLYQHQPQSSSHQFNYVMKTEEPEKASGAFVDRLLQQHQLQQEKNQSASRLFNSLVGNEEAGQASGSYVGSLHQNPRQYQSPHHQLNYVMGSDQEPCQASGTYVGRSLHRNQQQPQQYQSPHQFNYVMGNGEPGQAFGTYVGSLHQNHLQQPHQYQSSHLFNYVVGSEEPGQASGIYVGPLRQNQPHPQQNQSPHQFNNVMGNGEPGQASSIGGTRLEPTYPSGPQPQEYQSSHQFNHEMSNEEPQQASGMGVAGLELSYLSVPHHPFEDPMSGYDYSQ